jgi:hypothetical protein
VELARGLAAVCPDFPVAVISGPVVEQEEREVKDAGARIVKPTTIQELSTALRELLRGQSAS